MKKYWKNLAVREYNRRCNTIENIHEVLCRRDQFTLVRETVTTMSVIFFLSFLPFLILEIKKIMHSESLYHKDSTTSRPLNKFEPCWVKIVPGSVTKYEYPVL